MKKVLKVFLYIVVGLIVLIIGVFSYLYVSSSIASKKHMAILGPEAPTLLIENNTFRDLNKNGKLDTYEDYRQPIDARIENLLSQMNIEEKAGLMFITMTGIGNDGELSEAKTIFNPFSIPFLANSEMVVNKKMNHFNTLQSPEPKALVAWNNNIQKLAERTRLGIPVTHATDPRHGVPNAPGAIFGQFKPTGKLPFELPSSMEAVLNQSEDMPHDSKDPLYPFGFGISYLEKLNINR